jgi:hypothetical protein
VKSYEVIGGILGVSKGTIKSHEKRGETDSEAPARHCLLTVTEICEIYAIIERRLAEGAPMSYTQVADEIEVRLARS